MLRIALVPSCDVYVTNAQNVSNAISMIQSSNVRLMVCNLSQINCTQSFGGGWPYWQPFYPTCGDACSKTIRLPYRHMVFDAYLILSQINCTRKIPANHLRSGSYPHQTGLPTTLPIWNRPRP